MPEKHSENKIMAMLERRGIIRKAGSDDDISADEYIKDPRDEVDIRALIEMHTDDTQKAKPASRQPIPGISTPVFPSDKPETLPGEEPEQKEAVKPAPEPVDEYEEAEAEEFAAAEIQKPEEPARTAEQAKSTPIFGNLNPFSRGQSTEPKSVAPVEIPVYERQPAQASTENYTDRYLNIDELFDALSLKSKKTDTIYLVEEYIKTLPDSLPDASRRDIVLKIIGASGFDYDLLLGDGVLRVKMLKEYAERFARYTDEYISARQAELDELDQQILRVRRLVENRRELHKKQFLSIEAEAQRLKEILTFISG